MVTQIRVAIFYAVTFFVEELMLYIYPFHFLYTSLQLSFCFVVLRVRQNFKRNLGYKQYENEKDCAVMLLWALSIQANKPLDKNKVVLSGIVKVGNTGELLIGATIYFTELESGTITN
ncbi:carboxypeptidase-like regulatory domain-containing protein [Labilibacter sediminis]|nr:carboxypeptidase-like regulatory domain-containing protein [Labilibacter sediminis]